MRSPWADFGRTRGALQAARGYHAGRMLKRCSWLVVIAALLMPEAARAADAIDWARFLARHDLVWDRLPDRWEEGAFLGNGMMGAMAYGVAKDALAWELGRSDVTEHRPAGHPLP